MKAQQTTMDRVIAIDGPAASGKSTVAQRVARALGYLYVDSGSLYRAVTWKVLEDGVAGDNAAEVNRTLEGCRFDFFAGDCRVGFRLNGRELTHELRTDAINRQVSPVAAQPEVRRRVVAWLRDLIRFGPLVMEGRDIGTAVFPASPHKFYLDASPEERARRRHREMAAEGEGAGAVESVGQSLERRDRIDSTRKKDPLRMAPDAVVIDSTGLSVDEVVERILEVLRKNDC